MESTSSPPTIRNFLAILLTLGISVGCGSPSSGPQSPQPSPSGSNLVPQFGHVFLVVEENHNYSDIIGNSAMPYLNSLATQYGLATQYYANTHPSIGNYFMLTTGQIVTNNDSMTGTVSVENIVRELIAAGKTWKSYAESIPSAGYVGGDSYPYAQHHNPFSYFTDVVNSSSEVQNLTSLSQFQSDFGEQSAAELFLFSAESLGRRA